MKPGGVYGLILASGRSARFGGEKLLAKLGGIPLGRWIIQAALASSLDGLCLVVRPELAAALTPDDPRLVVVFNPDYAKGQAASIRAGLAGQTGEAGHILIMLADQPLITTSLIDHYVSLAAQGVELAALQDGGRLKPPSLFRRGYFEQLAALRGDTGGRAILEKNRDLVHEVEPEMPGQATDVDRPEDLEKIIRRLNLK